MKIDGFREALLLLRELDESTRERILGEMLTRDPALVARLREQLLVFEDLAALEPRELQEIARAVPATVLSLALRGISDGFKTAWARSLSKRQWEILCEETKAWGPKPRAEVDRARAKVLEQARELETRGKILLKKAG